MRAKAEGTLETEGPLLPRELVHRPGIHVNRMRPVTCPVFKYERGILST